MSNPSDENAKLRLIAEVPSRQAAEWGLASVLIGSVLLLMAPLMMSLLAVGWYSQNEWDADGRDAIGVTMIVAVIALAVLSVCGLLFAALGLVSALARRQPMGLSVAGIVISIVSILFWAIVVTSTFIMVGEATERKNPAYSGRRPAPTIQKTVRPMMIATPAARLGG